MQQGVHIFTGAEAGGVVITNANTAPFSSQWPPPHHDPGGARSLRSAQRQGACCAGVCRVPHRRRAVGPGFWGQKRLRRSWMWMPASFFCALCRGGTALLFGLWVVGRFFNSRVCFMASGPDRPTTQACLVWPKSASRLLFCFVGCCRAASGLKSRGSRERGVGTRRSLSGSSMAQTPPLIL